MAAPAETTSRTYGNWRKPVSGGVFGLGTIGTGLMLGGLVVMILAIMVAGIVVGLAIGVVVAAVLAALVLSDRHDRTGVQRLATRLGWWRTRRSGASWYRSGPLGRTPWGTFQLPGLLAASTLTEASDSYGRPFALLHVPSTGDCVVVLATEPDGASLVDPDQVDAWVAHWGQWLALLGDEPGLVAAAVTVETAPDSGTRLRREVENNADENAPAVAQAMLRQVVESYPIGSATVRAWVSLTFSAAASATGKRRSLDEVAQDLAIRLPGLTQSLHATGAGAARPARAQELCEVVRTAYDPQAARLLDAARADGQVPDLAWSDVGPTATQAYWDHLVHDGARSVTWSMSGAPRGAVTSAILAKLLAPSVDVDRKRVTVLYRPLDAGRAADAVDRNVNAASFRVTSAARPSARATADHRAALQTAEEEASGAGLVDFGMVVTATVADADRLPTARAAIDRLSSTARIRLRVAHGSQDSAFLAGLPLGLSLQRHSRVPALIRENL